MFILALAEKSTDGAFCVIDDDGEKVLYFFEDYDDAERYLGMLDAEDDYPKMEIVEVEDQLAIKTCIMYNYSYVVIKPDDIVIPPRKDAIPSEN